MRQSAGRDSIRAPELPTCISPTFPPGVLFREGQFLLSKQFRVCIHCFSLCTKGGCVCMVGWTGNFLNQSVEGQFLKIKYFEDL